MTQEKINTYFQSSLGQQCNSLFTTPDDMVFIRHSEAAGHCAKKGFSIQSIEEWFEEPDGRTYEQMENAVEAAISILLKDHPEFEEENTTGWDMIQTLKFLKNYIL